MANNAKALSASLFKKEVEKGAIILDTRKADDFEKGFIKGSINIGLNGQYAVWVGTLVDIKKPLLLVAEEGKEEEAVLRLARVGYENVLGYLAGGVKNWNEPLDTITSIHPHEIPTYKKAGFDVLDVRKPGEWSAGHLKDAQFLPLADFPVNLKETDNEANHVIHCAGGYRSMIAISIMKRQGFTGKLVNVYGGFGEMKKILAEDVVVPESAQFV